MKKRIIAAILTLCMTVTLGAGFSAAAASPEETYQTDYQAYKTFYSGVYEPAYHAYNAKLTAFADAVSKMDLQTMAQFDRIMNFINQLKAERHAFFGDRVTPGTSRYEVPYLRDAMYAAEESEDFTQAVSYCAQLVTAVQKRVDFLGRLSAEIDDFEVAPPAPDASDVTVKFVCNKWSNGSFGFTITISNASSSPIENWTLGFDSKKSATLTGAWMGGGGSVNMKIKDAHVTLSPANQFQNGYTIPAGGSVVVEGSGTGNATGWGASNFTINGSGVSGSFSVNG